MFTSCRVVFFSNISCQGVQLIIHPNEFGFTALEIAILMYGSAPSGYSEINKDALIYRNLTLAQTVMSALLSAHPNGGILAALLLHFSSPVMAFACPKVMQSDRHIFQPDQRTPYVRQLHAPAMLLPVVHHTNPRLHSSQTSLSISLPCTMAWTTVANPASVASPK